MNYSIKNTVYLIALLIILILVNRFVSDKYKKLNQKINVQTKRFEKMIKLNKNLNVLKNKKDSLKEFILTNNEGFLSIFESTNSELDITSKVTYIKPQPPVKKDMHTIKKYNIKYQGLDYKSLINIFQSYNKKKILIKYSSIDIKTDYEYKNVFDLLMDIEYYTFNKNE